MLNREIGAKRFENLRLTLCRKPSEGKNGDGIDIFRSDYWPQFHFKHPYFRPAWLFSKFPKSAIQSDSLRKEKIRKEKIEVADGIAYPHQVPITTQSQTSNKHETAQIAETQWDWSGIIVFGIFFSKSTLCEHSLLISQAFVSAPDIHLLLSHPSQMHRDT